MKRIFCIAASLLATVSFSITLNAQTAKDLIAQNPERAANVYHNYEVPIIQDTPAPKGYTPIYISHYGRHGSRYHTGYSFFKSGIDTFEAASKAGILTNQGRELQKNFEMLAKAHEGMYGSLTQKGGATHVGIARRMYGRFPQVFNNKERKVINCTSSIIPRCLVSMNFFSSELTKLAPKEEFHFFCSDKSMAFIAHDIDMENMHKVNERKSDSIRALRFNPKRMMHLLFTDADKATSIMNGNVQRFFKSVYLAGSIVQDMDAPYDKMDIFKFFNDDELYTQWWAYNARMYENHCNSQEYGDYRAKTAANLLKHITEEADSALEGDKIAADFCFGHDTGLLPLINLIKIAGQDKYYKLEEASEHWLGFETMPMAANIQFVFYSNPKAKDNLLVKILFNEKETTIPALKTVCGPYYKWSEMRTYFKSIYQPLVATQKPEQLPTNQD